MPKPINLHDFRVLAQRRLPKIAFDFIDGGADDELGMLRNREAFSTYQLLPRYLIDVTHRDQSVELFGRRYASPIGISPTGMAGLFRTGADAMLAGAAKKQTSRFSYRVQAISKSKMPRKSRLKMSGSRCTRRAILASMKTSSNGLGMQMWAF